MESLLTKQPQTSSSDKICLEFLPLEIKLLILPQISNVKALRNLTHASPLFRRAFRDAPEDILTQVTLNDLAARNIDVFNLGDVCEISMKSTSKKRCGCHKVLRLPVPHRFETTYRSAMDFYDGLMPESDLPHEAQPCSMYDSIWPSPELKYAIYDIKRQTTSGGTGMIILEVWECVALMTVAEIVPWVLTETYSTFHKGVEMDCLVYRRPEGTQGKTLGGRFSFVECGVVKEWTEDHVVYVREDEPFWEQYWQRIETLTDLAG